MFNKKTMALYLGEKICYYDSKKSIIYKIFISPHCSISINTKDFYIYELLKNLMMQTYIEPYILNNNYLIYNSKNTKFEEYESSNFSLYPTIGCITLLDSEITFPYKRIQYMINNNEEFVNIYFDTKILKKWSYMLSILKKIVKNDDDLPFNYDPIIFIRINGQLGIYLKRYDEDDIFKYIPANWIKRNSRNYFDRIRLISSLSEKNLSEKWLNEIFDIEKKKNLSLKEKVLKRI